VRRRLTIWAVGTVFGLAMADCGGSSLAPPPVGTFEPAPDLQQRAVSCRASDAHGNCAIWLRRE
jgi:hypothetical protein